MTKKKLSKKELRKLLSETIQKAVGTLELPKANKKIRKLIDHQARKLAGEFASVIKDGEKKQKKADKKMEKAVNTDGKKKKDKPVTAGKLPEKDKKSQNGKLLEPIKI